MPLALWLTPRLVLVERLTDVVSFFSTVWVSNGPIEDICFRDDQRLTGAESLDDMYLIPYPARDTISSDTIDGNKHLLDLASVVSEVHGDKERLVRWKAA